MIRIIKKDGTLEDFDEQKIVNACDKAARRAMFEFSENDYSIILNDVYIGDDSYIENCIVESRDTLRPGTNYVGTEDEIKIVVEKNVRYIL